MSSLLYQFGHVMKAADTLERENREIRVRLADGERRMDYLSEENVRRQQEVIRIIDDMRALASYVTRSLAREKPGRMARIWETIKSCGDIGDKVRWLILLIVALSLNSDAAKDILLRALGLD